jgi:hypothetical protein
MLASVSQAVGSHLLPRRHTSLLARQFGPVYVMRGKLPTFPNTYTGAGGKGLEVMPNAQSRTTQRKLREAKRRGFSPTLAFRRNVPSPCPPDLRRSSRACSIRSSIESQTALGQRGGDSLLPIGRKWQG